MNDALVHRGPDDSGIYRYEHAGIALGARRLSIIDVSGGHQPTCNEDQTIWARLSELGFANAQGYFIGPPMPAAELAEWRATRV